MSELGGRLRLKVGEGHTLLNFRQYHPPPHLSLTLRTKTVSSKETILVNQIAAIHCVLL